MKSPLDHLDDCQGMHYRVQLNIYKYILETYYGFTVAAMYVVCTHPDNAPRAFVDSVPSMQDAIRLIMEEQRELVREHTGLQREDYSFWNPLGGAGSHFDDTQDDADWLLHQEEDDREALSTEPRQANNPAGPSGSGVTAPAHQPGLAVGSSDPWVPVAPAEASPVVVARPDASQVSIHPDQDIPDLEVEPNASLEAFSKKRKAIPGASSSTLDFQAFFADIEAAAVQTCTGHSGQIPETAGCITHIERRLRKLVTERKTEWPEYLVRLGVGALAIYRMRLCDLFIREHVMLIWIFEGQTNIRIHDGIAYFYDERGSFMVYKGIPPEGVFYRVKRMLIRLEGVFRLLRADCPRTDGALLDAIDEEFKQGDDLQTLLNKAADASVFLKGDSRHKKGKGGGKGDEEEQLDDYAGWPVMVSRAIGKAGLSTNASPTHIREPTVPFLENW